MPRKKEMGRSANGTGTIRKKTVIKNGKEYIYWEARYTTGFDPGTGKQIQRSITAKTQKEVAQKLKQATYEIDQGTYLAPTKLTVEEWLDIWVKDYLEDVKSSTKYLYMRNVEQYIIPHLGAVKLEALTSPMVQALYNKLLKPENVDVKALSAKSIRNVHGVLHKALQQAVLNGYLRVNPSDACKPPRVVKKEIQPLNETQVSEFLVAIQGHTHEYLYKITLFTGMREGEVLGLTWDCLDLEHGTLLIKQQLRREQKKGGKYYFSPPKNNKTRVLTLAPSVIQLFRLQKLKQNGMRLKAGDCWEENSLVFSNQTGGFLSYRTVYDCFKRIMVKIGSPSTRFHDLRHTYAVLAIKSGDDIKTVQENLGHATAAFTLDIYGHVTAQMRRNSADRMEQVIKSVSTG
ncbi:tyrosine-type recombinase/integrase [Dysosmobacter sp. Sow4_B12]|uniref:tyrosine-type recombinase/integrase n=1 Tax=Dysosmobacter sp. Sow4_B12 TaxID=3438777 RepID=UPI003F93C83F